MVSGGGGGDRDAKSVGCDGGVVMMVEMTCGVCVCVCVCSSGDVSDDSGDDRCVFGGLFVCLFV